MGSFALKVIAESLEKNKIYKLFENGVCEFDNFIDSVDKRYPKEVDKIFYTIDLLATGYSFAQDRFKEITPVKEFVNEFEIKTKHLRVYLIKRPNSKLVICAGFKTTQKQDINHFRKIKERYLKGESYGKVGNIE